MLKEELQKELFQRNIEIDDLKSEIRKIRGITDAQNSSVKSLDSKNERLSSGLNDVIVAVGAFLSVESPQVINAIYDPTVFNGHTEDRDISDVEKMLNHIMVIASSAYAEPVTGIRGY